MEEKQEAAEKVEKPVKSNQAQLIPISAESQALAPTDHHQLIRFIDQMITAGALPKHLKTREEVISAWNYAAQLKLPPQPSLRNVAIIEGTPSLFGDLPLALVQRHGDFEFYEEFTIDEAYNRICFENKNLDAEVWGGVVRFQRTGMANPQSFAFTRKDADRAGLFRRAKPGMPWHSYPQVMLVRRARIIGIRALFADALCGASIAEDFGYAPDLKDVTPHVDRSAALNARFSGGESNEFNTVRSQGQSNSEPGYAQNGGGQAEGLHGEAP